MKIMWEGNEAEVVFGKEVTWGKYKELNQKSIVIKEYKGEPMQFRNTDLLEDLYLLASIKSAPFDLTIENLDKLSIEDRSKLINATTNILNR